MDMAKPIIRFKGYQDDWEQRKLGDLTEELSEYATMASGLPLLTSSRSGLMYQSDFRDRKTTTSDETLFSIVPKGSCTYRHMSDDDIFHLNINVLEKGLVSREYPVFISSENNDLEFIIQHINSSDRFRAFCKGQKKGGTRTRLYYKTLCEFEMMIPSIEEQKKISATLHSLDYLITLHQRKCDETKRLKKYMLQKMFPQNGEKVPEIRFSGFTDDWEQRKLEDIAEFSKGSGYSKGDLIESGTPIILYGRLYTKYETSISEVDTYVEAKDGSVYSKGGEVIVPASGETAEDIARAATVDKSGVILGGDLNVVSPNEDINSAFLAISISHGNSQRELAKKAQGKSVVHIHNEEIKNLVVPFSANAEQNKIVEYFSNLDHLITLHQRELENLQNIKKFMLGKMFV